MVATQGADLDALRADLAGQAEHGEGSLTVAVSDSQAILDALDAQHSVLVTDMDEALGVRGDPRARAPADSRARPPRRSRRAIRSAGCLFVGSASGTAFGDYVAGSNHVLPTEGAARFASGLNVRHFRRRMAEVHVGCAGPRWPPPACRSREAEAFPAHAASMGCVRILAREPAPLRSPARRGRPTSR